MRLFIATALPAPVISSVSAMRNELTAESESVRWVRNESLHLTLKFLGEVSEDQIDRIDNSLGNIEIAPFTVRVAGIGFFPNEQAPRVLWAGVRSKRLRALADLVEGHMVELGFKAGNREFNPHLTLARSRRDNRIEGRLVEKALPFRDRRFGRFETDRFFLYESRLESSGAVYTKRREYVLEGPTAADMTEE